MKGRTFFSLWRIFHNDKQNLQMICAWKTFIKRRRKRKEIINRNKEITIKWEYFMWSLIFVTDKSQQQVVLISLIMHAVLITKYSSFSFENKSHVLIANWHLFQTFEKEYSKWCQNKLPEFLKKIGSSFDASITFSAFVRISVKILILCTRLKCLS